MITSVGILPELLDPADAHMTQGGAIAVDREGPSRWTSSAE